MEWLFVLKDKGTRNQGWWLKISNVDELCAYISEVDPTRYGKVFENYVMGKEWNDYHPAFKNKNHSPHFNSVPLTDAIVKYGASNGLKIASAIDSFRAMVAFQQLESIRENGAIYINRVGGYHGYYAGDKEYAFIRRKELVFPQFKKDEIRIKQFPNGEHYYAYIDDMQVRDGDILKWDTYEEAYNRALEMIEK